MRKIKFRAWDKDYKIMFSVDILNFNRGAFLTDLPKGENIDNKNGLISVAPEKGQFRSFDKITLMQYAGLKDKNGKETYESDLVKKYNSIYVVKWYDKSCKFILQNIQHDFESSNMHSTVEVVGNIYENPELLNKE